MSSAPGRFLGLTLLALATAVSTAHAAPPTRADAAPAIAAPAQSKEAARMESFAKPNGDSYFALSLVPQAALSPTESSDVVILFDTSASQLGAYRETGLEVLKGLLATLGDKDHVKLVAVDVDAVPLTENFVAPRGPEIAAAIEKLQRRVPLGSTDLEAALNGARKVMPAHLQPPALRSTLATASAMPTSLARMLPRCSTAS